MGIKAPSILTETHQLASFSCGHPELDNWLIKKALKNQKRGNARVYVTEETDTKHLVGYYAIAMGSVQRNHAVSVLQRNAPDPIPMVILARLGVDKNYQGKGIGVGLLKDCVLRSLHAMESVGGAGILVHAIDEQAQSFYKKFGFKESKFDPLILMARVCDIQAAMQDNTQSN